MGMLSLEQRASRTLNSTSILHGLVREAPSLFPPQMKGSKREAGSTLIADASTFSGFAALQTSTMVHMSVAPPGQSVCSNQAWNILLQSLARVCTWYCSCAFRFPRAGNRRSTSSTHSQPARAEYFRPLASRSKRMTESFGPQIVA